MSLSLRWRTSRVLKSSSRYLGSYIFLRLATVSQTIICWYILPSPNASWLLLGPLRIRLAPWVQGSRINYKIVWRPIDHKGSTNHVCSRCVSRCKPVGQVIVQRLYHNTLFYYPPLARLSRVQPWFIVQGATGQDGSCVLCGCDATTSTVRRWKWSWMLTVR